MVAPYTPLLAGARLTLSWDGRVRMFVTGVHVVRSVLACSGAPGAYSKLELTM
jgi:hypothetical protein